MAQVTGRLTERAVLVSLKLTKIGQSKTDKRVSQEVADAHNADVALGRYVKLTFPPEALDPIDKVDGRIRQEHYKRTLAWDDGDTRILSGDGILDAPDGTPGYETAMRRLFDERENLVDEFVQNYPGYVQEMARRQNGLFDASAYPHQSEVKAQFSASKRLKPLPDVSDFRINAGDELLDALKAQYAEQIAESEAAIKREVVERLRAPVAQMAKRLREYGEKVAERERTGETGKVGAPRLHDSIVGNIQDVVNLLGTLNLTNDPEIAYVGEQMRSFLTEYDPEVLKTSAPVRENVADAADAILEKLNKFIA